MSFLIITGQSQFEPAQTFSYAGRVLVALLLSLLVHASVFFTWMHLQTAPDRHIIVQGELLPPVIMEPSPRIEPLLPLPPVEPDTLTPVHKQQLPISKHETHEQRPRQALKHEASLAPKLGSNVAVTKSTANQAPDSGVALPLLTQKAGATSVDTHDYVVPEVQSLSTDDKIPFASKPGELPLPQYGPATASTSDSNEVRTAPNVTEITESMLDSGALAEYGRGLGEKAQQLISYPTLAQYRGWEGAAEVLVKYDRKGVAYQISIKDSSGQQILDNQALKTVKKACADFALPTKLVGKAFSIVVPVDFVLKK